MTSSIKRIDTDAAAFIAATGISDAAIAHDITFLVQAAKAHGWWTKCNAIYPFVGGTATTHKYNLKDPRDLDAAFRITFNGSWTHSSTGILPDAATTYGQTHLIPSSVLTVGDMHLSVYSRTSGAGPGGTNYDIGASSGTSNIFAMVIKRIDGIGIFLNISAGTQLAPSIANASGLFLDSRTTTTAHALYRNGSSVTSNATLEAHTNSTVEMYIGALNNGGTGAIGFTSKECAFITIGSGIDATLQALMYTDIQNFQTARGRQV
jgi:hypothetical protein